ncbi:MAG: GNAT family N-acetyltransferase [Bacteroidia bacterium]|nr:GNAT family N-acetyltransferase [Bacteroidia bacterium]
MSFTRIISLDRYNWELALNISLSPEQEVYTPSVMYSLAQAKFENLIPYGITYKGKMVGMMMYGDFGGICWISRILIDQEFQRMGIGSTALRQLVEILERKMSCKEIRTSYAKGNYAASSFFAEMGFEPLEDALNEEVVLRYQPDSRQADFY